MYFFKKSTDKKISNMPSIKTRDIFKILGDSLSFFMEKLMSLVFFISSTAADVDAKQLYASVNIMSAIKTLITKISL